MMVIKPLVCKCVKGLFNGLLSVTGVWSSCCPPAVKALKEERANTSRDSPSVKENTKRHLKGESKRKTKMWNVAVKWDKTETFAGFSFPHKTRASVLRARMCL